jgi:hypothetical protein
MPTQDLEKLIDEAYEAGAPQAEIDAYETIYAERVTDEEVSKALHNLAKNVPIKLRSTVWETLNLEPYSKYNKNSMHFIFMIVNRVCSKWGKTSYEVADAYSRKIFDQINIGAVI